jgi:hypothetical protein
MEMLERRKKWENWYNFGNKQEFNWKAKLISLKQIVTT